MTYQQMRVLFACLARYDGRLSVLAARSQEPWTQWGVCLCDHVRQTWRCVGRLEPLRVRGRLLGSRERPLSELQALLEPDGATMTWPDHEATMRWPEVLRAFDVLERDAPGWFLAALTATRPAQGTPRYQLVVRDDAGRILREANSYEAFEDIVSTAPQG
jgi:hypothetical protein